MSPEGSQDLPAAEDAESPLISLGAMSLEDVAEMEEGALADAVKRVIGDDGEGPVLASFSASA